MLLYTDKSSTWGYDNGLKSMVTTLLQFGLVGYPFVLPDMIGGAYFKSISKVEEILLSTPCIEEESDRREDKGRRCCLRDIHECRTSHLAAG